MKDFFKKSINQILAVLICLLAIGGVTTFLLMGSPDENGKQVMIGGQTSQAPAGYAEYECAQNEAIQSAVAELTGSEVVQDSGANCLPEGVDIAQMGAIPYYKVDVSTPTAFYNVANGKCWDESFGCQCVSGFKEFMFALSGSYVATSTGGASGYANQQWQIEPLGFTWHAGSSGLQNGDWGIFNNGTYGHVSMYYNGKWFGQNQGAANPNAGNAFNLMSLGITPVGYYRPNIYAQGTPGGGNTNDDTSNNSGNVNTPPNTYTVVVGDTLGGIALKNGWWSSVNGLFGDSGYAQRLADKNGILNRGLIYPLQVINR
jgi:hypothetical protein